MTETTVVKTHIKKGDIAPDFALVADDGRQVHLSDFKGRAIALYFYPMDHTPGCITEAVGIRDAWAGFMSRDVVVLGVSSDDIPSHRDFKECYLLPFTLLSDPEHVVCDLYGTWGLGDKATRTTFLIDEEGRVLNVWELVDPTRHAKWLLGEVDKHLAQASSRV